jgi:hypothetical protein
MQARRFPPPRIDCGAVREPNAIANPNVSALVRTGAYATNQNKLQFVALGGLVDK